MVDAIRVMVEAGKKKKTVAVAFDWPGWDRNGKDEDAALEKLAAYRPRYANVAALAGLGEEFAAAGELDVVERVEGAPSTDFHGVSCRAAAPELEQMSTDECERKIALLRACWATFDEVAARVSPELRKGPRGGGRDRDRIVMHTVGHEMVDLAKNVGFSSPDLSWEDPAAIQAHREAMCAAIREYNARGLMARSWSVQFLIRRCAYHMLDHAWEMEDRDMTGEP
jgi:hypothetical protein